MQNNITKFSFTTSILLSGTFSIRLNQDGYISMYRWHLPDPVYWKKECRITIQQIGWSREQQEKTGHALFERQDDWCSAIFWYEPISSAPLPPFPNLENRIADLD